MQHTMKQMFIAGLCLALLLVLGACTMTPQGLVPLQAVRGTGISETIEYDLAQFDSVAVGSTFEVTIQPGEIFRVVVEADTAYVPHLDVKVEAGTLHLGLEPAVRSMGAYTLRAEVTMPELKELRVSGASQADVAGFAARDSFDMTVSGASRVTAQIDAENAVVNLSGASRLTLTGAIDDLTLRVAGSSRATVQGQGQTLMVEASGASHVDSGEFSVADATLRASGASSITAHVNNLLEAHAGGSSSIRYSGAPPIRNQQASGAASIGPR